MSFTIRYSRAIFATVTAFALAATLGTWAATGGQAAATTAAPVLGIAAGGTLQFDPPATRDAYLKAAHDLGATWLRFDFTWNDIQRSNATTYDWARYDALVTAAQKYGLQIVGMIGYAPSWARDPACAGNGMCRPRSSAEYGTFAGKVAARYAPRGVSHWEIWNEPNTANFFRPAADPAYYATMLSSAYSAIHKADPKATVITGGTAPSGTGGGSYTPVDFVTKLYAAGAQGHFDALGHHPYCYAGTFDCPGTDAAWSAWSQMSWTKTSLRSLMTAHGDGAKKIWGTEFGAPTSGDPTAVTEAHQSTMLSGALRKFSSNSWAGPLFIYSLRDNGVDPKNKEDWFGVLRADGSRKGSFATLSAMLAHPVAVATPAVTAVATTPAATPVPTPSAVSPTTKAPAPVVPAPVSVTAITPARGPVAGGTTVTIQGTGLRGTSVSVKFAGRPATGVSVSTDGVIRAVTPAVSSAGPADVTVLVDGRSTVRAHGFDYRARRGSWWSRAWNSVF